jgi:hypothetical protein
MSAEVMERCVVKNGPIFAAWTIFARIKYKSKRFGVSQGKGIAYQGTFPAS